MRLELEDVRIQGRCGPLLDLRELTWETGECLLVAGAPGLAHTALALVLTGRLAPFEGRVQLIRDDGSQTREPQELRRVSSVVDVPEVTEPDGALQVATVAAESLALARRSARAGATRDWISSRDLGLGGSERMDALLGTTRVALLTALAVEPTNVRFLVLTLPERHGGEPAEWWALGEAYAAAGYGVLVQCGPSAARDLGVALPRADRTRDRRAIPVDALRTRPQTPAGHHDP